MATEIKCPNCNHSFPMEEVMVEEYKQELREKMTTYIRQKEQEVKKIEETYEQKLIQEKNALQSQLAESLRKTIGADFENKLKMLEESRKENEEKLKLARQKEFDFLKKEQEFKNKEAEIELETQRKLQEQRTEMEVKIRKWETERLNLIQTEHQLQLAEKNKQIEDQNKLIYEMKRKSEQGSMQLQGEVQELLLEDLLRNAFPFDLIEEVGKGARGADCIHTIRNQFGQSCGRIIYESKRTKDFSTDWIEKLKKDMRANAADLAVIVTQTYPKGMTHFGEKDGIWICSFEEAKAVSYVLRDGILKLFNACKSQENKGDKMHMLYDYLTGNEFSEQWKAVREGFMSMKLSIQKERDAMERLWKAREKQLEKVLLNAAHISGSIEGISGTNNIQLNLTDDDNELLLN